MGRTYYQHLIAHRAARLVAVFDQDPKRRSGQWEEQAGNFKRTEAQQENMAAVVACESFDELLACEAVEAVAITLPTPLHHDMTIRALEAGKHVLCEKPMALTLADCDRMIEAAERNNRTLMIAQCIRFWPQYERIEEIVAAGGVGKVLSVSMKRLSSVPSYSSDNWLMKHELSGGALFDLHVHDVDFAQHLLGVPKRIFAQGAIGPSGGLDHIVAMYSYDDGVCVELEGSWRHQPPWPFEMSIRVVGDAGTLSWNMNRGDEVLHYRGGDEPVRIAVSGETGWTREIDYFVDCIARGEPVRRCEPRSSRTSIALTLLEKESVERGEVVDVSL
jgi:predicted dehydrogenase